MGGPVFRRQGPHPLLGSDYLELKFRGGWATPLPHLVLQVVGEALQNTFWRGAGSLLVGLDPVPRRSFPIGTVGKKPGPAHRASTPSTLP